MKIPHDRLSRRPSGAMAAALVGTLFLAGASHPALGAVDDFYRSKQVRVMIGFHPGGGYDAYGRLLARHIGKHIPGNPSVIAVNFPGAGSLRLANYLYNKAPKDGLSFGTFAGSTAFSPLFGVKQAKFETAKFTWIGNVDQSIGSCATWYKTGIKSFDDLRKREVIFGATGPSSVASQFARGLNALLGTRIKIIHGYPGSTGVLLAMKRGEVAAGCGFALSALKAARRQDWKSGRLIVLIQTGIKKAPEFAGVPHIYDLVKNDEDKKVVDLIYGRHVFGRPFAAPPGLPRARKQALRAAFMATMKDPAFLKDAERLHVPVNPWSGEEVDAALAKFLSYPQKIVMRARQALETGKVIKVKLKKLDGTIAKVGKKRIQVTDGAGKSHSFKISGRRSKIKLAGQKAKRKALKAGMRCSFRYFGEGDLAKTINCQ